MKRLEHQVAIITGVSSGIGRAAARLFCEQGADVFGIDCDTGAGETLAGELLAQGYSFVFYAADLSLPSQCVQAVDDCWRTFGRIDVLYNNAGISAVLPFNQTDQDTLERLMAVNFMSMFYLCQQVLPRMQRQGQGVIINTASELAIVAQPLYTAYCATKGAVLSFTRALALEYAQAKIRINALCPGPIDTPMLQHEFETEPDPIQARHQGIATMPIGRLGTPEEIAQVALFLAADAPALMQGATIVVDGAKTIV